MSEVKPSNLICVCSKCRHHQNNAHVEVNFGDRTIYWCCPECKEMNKLAFPSSETTPLPRSTTMLGRSRRRN